MIDTLTPPGSDAEVGKELDLEGKLLENSAFFAGSVLLVMAFESISSVIVARLLASEATYGMLAVILSILGLAGPFAALSLPEGVTKLVAESRGSSALSTRAVISTSLLLLLVTSGLTATILAVAGKALATSLYNANALGGLLVVASVAVVTGAVSSLVLSTIRGFEMVRWLGVVNVVNSAASIPLALVLLPTFGLAGAVIAVVLNPLVIIGVGAFVIRRGLAESAARKSAWNREVLGRLLRFSSPLFLSTLLVVGVVWALNALLVLAGGFPNAGEFRIGYNLYTIFLALTSSIAVPLMPLVSRLDSSKTGISSTLLADVFRLVLLTALPVTLAVAVFSRQLILLLYGPAYESSWQAAFAMMAAVVVASTVPSASAVLQGFGRTWQILKFDALYAGCIIPLSLFLIPRAGSWGAGLAYTLSYGILSIALLAYIRRLAHFDPKTMVVPLVLALLSFSLGLLIVSYLNGILFVTGGVACVLGTTAACWLAMSSKERRTVRRLLNRFRQIPKFAN